MIEPNFNIKGPEPTMACKYCLSHIELSELDAHEGRCMENKSIFKVVNLFSKLFTAKYPVAIVIIREGVWVVICECGFSVSVSNKSLIQRIKCRFFTGKSIDEIIDNATSWVVTLPKERPWESRPKKSG